MAGITPIFVPHPGNNTDVPRPTLDLRLKVDLHNVPLFMDQTAWIKFSDKSNRFDYEHSFDIYRSCSIVQKLPYNYVEEFFKDIENVQYSKISSIFLDMTDGVVPL